MTWWKNYLECIMPSHVINHKQIVRPFLTTWILVRDWHIRKMCFQESIINLLNTADLIEPTHMTIWIGMATEQSLGERRRLFLADPLNYVFVIIWILILQSKFEDRSQFCTQHHWMCLLYMMCTYNWTVWWAKLKAHLKKSFSVYNNLRT